MQCSRMRNSFGGDKIGNKTWDKSGDFFFSPRDLKTKSNLEDETFEISLASEAGTAEEGTSR